MKFIFGTEAKDKDGKKIVYKAGEAYEIDDDDLAKRLIKEGRAEPTKAAPAPKKE
jgi:hypothetical protein